MLESVWGPRPASGRCQCARTRHVNLQLARPAKGDVDAAALQRKISKQRHAKTCKDQISESKAKQRPEIHRNSKAHTIHSRQDMDPVQGLLKLCFLCSFEVGLLRALDSLDAFGGQCSWRSSESSFQTRHEHSTAVPLTPLWLYA